MMAQSVVPQKEKKMRAVFEAMKDKSSFDEFRDTFLRMFPDDWKRINKRYIEHERKDTKGKGHPMPKPYTYLLNMHKVYHIKWYRQR